jgi:putative transposase
LAERIEVCQLFISKGFSVKPVLSTAKIARSTWYDQHKSRRISSIKPTGRRPTAYSRTKDGRSIPDTEVISHLKAYRYGTPFFDNAGGYRKLSRYLSMDFGININHKKVYRLCSENNLLLPINRLKKRRRTRCSINRVVTAPHKLWEFDIKYGYVHGEDRFFYLLAFIDVFSRKVVGFYVGLSCKANDWCLH